MLAFAHIPTGTTVNKARTRIDTLKKAVPGKFAVDSPLEEAVLSELRL